MKDLTQGPIRGLILAMSAPIAVGMLVQTLYFLVDLYFVSRIGAAAVAGVTAGGNAVMLVMALTQMLSVGTVALISHAVGGKDQARANLVFNQSLGLALGCTLFTVLLGLVGIVPYMSTLGGSDAIAEAGRDYLLWYLPGLALQFPLAAMGSAMRGTGIAMPGMVVQMLTVLVNIVLAPILIAGWGTGHPMGVAGAGLASSLAVAAGVLAMLVYFLRLEKYVTLEVKELAPRGSVWGPLLRIGLPAGGEFALMFVFTAVTYWALRHFGSAAQAGFGIGARIMQGVFLPAMAIAFSIAPIAGQNFGARQPERVRATFWSAVKMCTGLMLVLMLLMQWRPDALVRFFSKEPEVVDIGSQFLHIISWNFVLSGIIFSCSSMFQALGNTLPSLYSSATRLITYSVPLIWVSTQPWFQLKHVWLLSVGTVILQTIVSFTLLQRQLRTRLTSLAVMPEKTQQPAQA